MTDRLEHFTNRDDQIAAFDALWSHNRRWVLAFHGLSGNGKSTLIDYLIETRCVPQELPYAILDFEDNRGVTLRTDWRALSGAIASGWGLADHSVYTRAREAALRQYEMVRSSLQVQLEQKADHGQISDSPITIDAGQSEALHQADDRARAQTAEALLQAAVATHGQQQLLLFLDTYERLAEMADKKYAGWLWNWLGQAAAQLPGLRVIVGSRTALAGLSRRERQQAELPPFGRADSDTLLQKLGVTDPAWRVAIYDRLANGHPLLTEMAGDLWQQAHQSGRPLPAADIPTLAGQEPAVEWLTGRILDRLPEPLKSAVRWAALLRRFNQETLADLLLPAGAPPLSDDDFDTLRRYSFVAPARVGRGWACHDLLRRVQNSYLRVRKPTAWQAFHEKAAAYFTASEADPKEDTLEALYHGLMAGDDAAEAAWPQAAYEAHFQFDYAHWAALLEIVDSPELSPPPGLAAEGRRWRGMYHRWRYEMDEALGSYEAALGLFRQVGSRLGEANTQLSMGNIARSEEAWSESWHYYEQALAAYAAIEDRYSQARVLYRIGDWYADQQNRVEAADYYQRAIGIWSSIGLDSLVDQILRPRLKAVSDEA